MEHCWYVMGMVAASKGGLAYCVVVHVAFTVKHVDWTGKYPDDRRGIRYDVWLANVMGPVFEAV